MTTIRVARRHRYTAVDRRTINDERLSFGARGLLVWLLDKPDDWSTSVERLADASPQGAYAVRNLVAELETHGYVVRTETVDPATKRFGYDWEVHEVPGEPPEPVAETASGLEPSRSRKPRPEPVAETAGLIETELQKTETPPPLPPRKRGEGTAEVVPRFKSNGTHADVPVLASVANGVPPGAPRAAAVMAVGGWVEAGDVPAHDAVVQAFYAAVSVPSSTDRKDIQARTRESQQMGEHPGMFLLVLGSANTYTARAVGLARGIVEREMAGTALVGLGVKSTQPSAAQRGIEKFKAAQARKRAASRVIDADSEEVHR